MSATLSATRDLFFVLDTLLTAARTRDEVSLDMTTASGSRYVVALDRNGNFTYATDSVSIPEDLRAGWLKEVHMTTFGNLALRTQAGPITTSTVINTEVAYDAYITL